MNQTFTISKRFLTLFTIVACLFFISESKGQTTVVAEDDTICSGQTTLLVASGADIYEWSPPTGLSSITGDSVYANPTITTTYRVVGVVIGTPSTQDTTYITITVQDSPIADAGADADICEGSTHVLSGSYLGDATGITWSTAGDGSFDDLNSPAAEYTPGSGDISTGSVVLSIVAHSWGPCASDTSEMLLTIHPQPTVDAGVNAAICENGTYTLSGSFGGGASSVTWTSSGDGSFSDDTLTNPLYTPGPGDIANGSVTLTLTTDDPASPCNAVSDDMELTIDELPVVDAGMDDIICGTVASVMLDGSVSGGTTTGTWTTNGDGTFNDPSLLNAEYTPDPSDTLVTLYLTSTNNGGCDAVQDSITITTLDSVVVNLTVQDDTICEGSSTTWTATGANSYAWSPSAGLNDTVGSTITAVPQIGVTYQVIGETYGCSDTVEVPVTVLPAPDLTIIIPDDTLCENLTDQWVAQSASADSFVWAPASLFSPSYGDTVMVTAAMDSVYTVTAISPIGCTFTDTVDFTVTPAPTANAGIDRTVCGNIADVPLNGSITIATGAEWATAGTGTFNDNTLINAEYSPTIADSTQGSVVLYLTTTGNGDCLSATDSMTITFVNSILVEVETEKDTVCEGEEVAWMASGADFYVWSPSTGLSATSGDSITATPQGGINYQVTGSVIGCNQTVAVPSTVLPMPTLSVSIPNDTLCGSDTDQWTAVSNADSAIAWFPNNAFSPNNGDTVIMTAETGTTYWVEAINHNGCKMVDSIDVHVKPIPNISLTLSHDTICQGDTANWKASGADFFSWTPSSGLQASIGDSIVAIPFADTTYQVTGELDGCFNTKTIPVVVGNAPPVITVTAEDSTICEDLSTNLTASGTVDNGIFQWSPATGLDNAVGASVIASPTTTTTYTISANRLGCPGDTTFTLEILPKPSMTASLEHGVICQNELEIVTITGDPLLTLEQIYPGGGYYTTTNNYFETNPEDTTTITVIGTGTNGCKNTIYVTVNVDDCVFTENMTLKDGISAYMNNHGQMIITMNEKIQGDFLLTVHDMLGRQVHSEVFKKTQGGEVKQIINIEDKANGVYILNVSSAEDNFGTKLYKQ